LEKFPVATRSTHRPASKTPCLTMLYHNISWRKNSRLVPGDSNLGHLKHQTTISGYTCRSRLALVSIIKTTFYLKLVQRVPYPRVDD
jgi:hypothetical protein